jgi:predicted ABC-type sugar transport system permease subunit
VSRSERPPAAAGPSARRLTERAFRIRESGIIVVLAVFVAVTAAVQPRFLNITNIQFILINTTVFALLALGETMVVISRNYDLSVGSVLGLSAYLSANLFGQHHGIPIAAVFLAHDIRHTAVVHRVLAWYRSGQDVQRLLPQLATYLGHIDVRSTQHYLQMTSDLLQAANQRFAQYAMEATHEG